MKLVKLTKELPGDESYYVNPAHIISVEERIVTKDNKKEVHSSIAIQSNYIWVTESPEEVLQKIEEV